MDELTLIYSLRSLPESATREIYQTAFEYFCKTAKFQLLHQQPSESLGQSYIGLTCVAPCLCRCSQPLLDRNLVLPRSDQS